MANELKIGACGLVCGKCPEYLSKRCKGCSPNISPEICPLPKCAKEKSVSLCFECQEFPCKQNYEKGPIVAPLLDHWKGKKSG